jgi:formylglycine-generating enzyme required for sulfatase activity
MNVKSLTLPSKIAWGLGATLLVGLTACRGGSGGGSSGAVTFNDCPGGDTACPVMVVIPKGSFQMGSPADEPGRYGNETQHGVTFANAFAVGKTPVTVGQWKAFLAANPTHSNNYAGCKTYAPGDDNPVVCVTWNDAQDYAAWLSKKTGQSYRLLSEAEWEYVARAGTTTAYPFDNITVDTSGNPASNKLAKYANYNDLRDYANAGADLGGAGTLDGYPYTSPVGHYGVNAFGVSDMIGNVWEWTQDCYVADYMNAGVPKDGTANTSGACKSRVRRGGSWVNFPRALRSASRYSNAPAYRLLMIGFRVAKTVPGGI